MNKIRITFLQQIFLMQKGDFLIYKSCQTDDDFGISCVRLRLGRLPYFSYNMGRQLRTCDNRKVWFAIKHAVFILKYDLQKSQVNQGGWKDMKETYYQIKEAAAKVGVESHVLRYWEEELKMDIHRNEMGHRYYTEKDIEVLSKVRDLKEKGLQLKAIRNYLEMRRKQITEKQVKKDNQIAAVAMSETDKEQENETAKNEMIPVHQRALTNEEKMEQFQQIMNRILSNAIRENNELIGKTAGEHAANAVVTQFQGMTKEQEQRAEERYRKLDQTLREIQQARLEAAAANMRPVDKRRQKRLKRKSNQQNHASGEKETVTEVETKTETIS